MAWGSPSLCAFSVSVIHETLVSERVRLSDESERGSEVVALPPEFKYFRT
jgi:hypothetical protein